MVGVAEAYKRLAMVDEAVDYYTRAQLLATACGSSQVQAYVAHGFADALLAQVRGVYIEASGCIAK